MLLQPNKMRKDVDSVTHSDSRKRVNKIFEQEQAVSKAFQVSNFYTNQRLNIVELKQRLQMLKKTNKQPSNKFQTPMKTFTPVFNSIHNQGMDRDNVNQYSTAKFPNGSDRPNKQLQKNQGNRTYDREPNNQKQSQGGRASEFDKAYSIQRKEGKAQYRIVKETRINRYQPKNKTANGRRGHQGLQPLHDLVVRKRVTSKMGKSRAEKTDYSKCSQGSLNRSWEEVKFEGKIILQSSQHLNEFQKQIHSLWQHYQLVTKILLGLKEGKRQEKNAIVKYVQDVCSDKFEFVKDLLSQLVPENPSKAEGNFLKRLKKVIILSKLYQNLALVYVSLQICLKIDPDSHLVNFIGYCTSNVIFVLRFIHLSHSLASHLQYSAHTLHILGVISQFQKQSYRAHIDKLPDLVLRMQHNNQTISIVQNRICQKMHSEFQNIIMNFLKNVDMESKPLLEYSHYIYQFLAFHLARINIVGQFSFVQMAPTPYLHLNKQRTLVIQPWQVLFALSKQDTFIRAYTQTLLGEVGKHWNIVYWTDLMPDRIDDLLAKLPPGSMLYRYHCRFENDRFLKLLWRIGCDTDNTIIIDRNQGNFKYDRQMGVELPWRGKKKDSKLIEVLNLLLPLLTLSATISLRKSFPSIKQQIIQLDKKNNLKRRMEIKTKDNESWNQSMYPRNLMKK